MTTSVDTRLLDLATINQLIGFYYCKAVNGDMGAYNVIDKLGYASAMVELGKTDQISTEDLEYIAGILVDHVNMVTADEILLSRSIANKNVYKGTEAYKSISGDDWTVIRGRLVELGDVGEKVIHACERTREAYNIA